MRILPQRFFKMKKLIKILFVGSDEGLLKIYSQRAEVEVVSSISHAQFLGDDYIPDLIFLNSKKDFLVKEIRQEKKFLSSPIIWIAEDFGDLDNLNSIIDFQRILICNRVIVQNEKFIKSLEELGKKNRSLLNPRTSSFVKYAILFLNKNISKNLKRNFLSNHLHLSQDYLTRIFHKEMGIQLWTYIEILRLHFSKKLLLESAKTISEVSACSGFKDSSYFNREFKKAYGVSPGEFRKSGQS